MTERSASALFRDRDTLAIGPSSLHWDGQVLIVRINEVDTPSLRNIRGEVRITPHSIGASDFALDSAAQHRWRPIAPCSRVEVKLQRPGISWSGEGYFDSNFGKVPLENSFSGWHWSRARLPDGAAVLYDIRERPASGADAGEEAGAQRSLALRFREDGSAERFAPPPTSALASTRWRIARDSRSEAGSPAGIVSTLEDTPFYARSLVSGKLLGQQVESFHESLDLDRFRRRWVQWLLHFRTPRVGR
ncbi:hypothetical protein [Rhodocyclus tenuis]|uniref:hypothetical protein n=1 Tax=Rhodocyclus tenuis TaxID=1066 RepID=UPI00190826E7|nr:hypothetical protein [Rhodocyclus tenuis]